MQDIVKHFLKSDLPKIKKCAYNGGDLSLIIEVAKDMQESELSLMQEWILEELHGKKNHGFDLFREQERQANITPMGERESYQKNEDGSTTVNILINDDEQNRILADAELIRETFIKNNPKTECMATEQIYWFLLGRYCEEQNEGDYQQIVNERLEYSSQGHER